MKKEILILTIILILIPATLAQEQVNDYNDFEELEIEIEVEGTVEVDRQSSKSRLEEIEIFLSYFPITDNRQTLDEQKITADPDSEITKEEGITYIWEDVEEDELTYRVSSTIKTENNFRKVARKIEYPLEEIPENVQEFLEPTEFIDITPPIRSQASVLVAGEDDYYQAFTNIAEWIRTNVNYTLLTLTAEAVQPSSWVLENRIGVCDELTNLFISMCRSVGIPARFVSGTVYTNIDYSFGNHGWAEVWVPDYGWVPVDVTFGQYGWVDPSHVKLKHSADSGEPAVNFVWRANKVQIIPGELGVQANVKETKGSITPYTSIKVIPNRNEAQFGSFLPVEVQVTNDNTHYVPVQVQLKKAPGIYQGLNARNVLMKPKSTESVFFVIEIPEDLDPDSRYTSVIGAETSFGAYDEAEIEFSAEARKYDINYALQNIETSEEREVKEEFTTLGVECEGDKETYYTAENATIECKISNRGEDLDNLKICLFEKCEQRNIAKGEVEEVEYLQKLSDTRQPLLVVENGNKILYKPIDIDIVKQPRVLVRNVNPEVIDYRDEKTLTFSFISDTEITDVFLNIKNVGTLTLEETRGQTRVTAPLKGWHPVDDQLEVVVMYKDELGKEYETDLVLNVEVQNIPFYGKVWNAIRRIF